MDFIFLTDLLVYVFDSDYGEHLELDNFIHSNFIHCISEGIVLLIL